MIVTLQSGLAQGLMWAILTIGVFLTFRILDIPDLTVEGSFPLGAAVTVVLINNGASIGVAMLSCFIAGGLAGLVTGLLHTKLKIPAILAGILTQIALYSVNIRIMSDKATVALANDSLKTFVTGLLPEGMAPNTITVIVGLIVCAIIIFILYRFFGTEIGCAIRATGSNQKMARALGINTDAMINLCLAISNALVALSGSLIAQFDYGSALVNMGQGTIVIGLASVIVGEILFIRKERNFAVMMAAVSAGAVIYRTIIAAALTLPWMKATDLKLITAAIVAIALAVPALQKTGKLPSRSNKTDKTDKKSASKKLGGAQNA